MRANTLNFIEYCERIEKESNKKEEKEIISRLKISYCKGTPCSRTIAGVLYSREAGGITLECIEENK